jgi:hypothetical protein
MCCLIQQEKDNLRRILYQTRIAQTTLVVAYGWRFWMVLLVGSFGWCIWLVFLVGVFGWRFWLVLLVGAFGWCFWLVLMEVRRRLLLTGGPVWLGFTQRQSAPQCNYVSSFRTSFPFLLVSGSLFIGGRLLRAAGHMENGSQPCSVLSHWIG